MEAGLEQVDRLALGGCRHVSADGAAVDVEGRLRDDRTVEGGILVPRQGGGDPKNRPRRSVRDVGERSCEGLAGVRWNGSANADRRLRSHLSVTSGYTVERERAATTCPQAEGAVDESVLDQLPDVSPPGTPTCLLSFAEIREARRRRSERLAELHAVEREDESGCRSCQFVCAVEYGDCGPVDERIDCSFGSRGEAELRPGVGTAAEEQWSSVGV